MEEFGIFISDTKVELKKDIHNLLARTRKERKEGSVEGYEDCLFVILNLVSVSFASLISIQKTRQKTDINSLSVPSSQAVPRPAGTRTSFLWRACNSLDELKGTESGFLNKDNRNNQLLVPHVGYFLIF